jgi:hypothetical protein
MATIGSHVGPGSSHPRRLLRYPAPNLHTRVRLRDIAARVGITERSAFAIVTDLTEAGYVVKRKDAAVTAIRFRRTSLCPSSQPRSAASGGRPNPQRPGPSGHWSQIVPQVKATAAVLPMRYSTVSTAPRLPAGGRARWTDQLEAVGDPEPAPGGCWTTWPVLGWKCSRCCWKPGPANRRRADRDLPGEGTRQATMGTGAKATRPGLGRQLKPRKSIEARGWYLPCRW